MYVLDERERALVREAIQKTLESIGYVKPATISLNKAYDKYGTGIVKRWIRQGKVSFERKGTCRNSVKTALVEDLERVYHSERNLSIKIKQG